MTIIQKSILLLLTPILAQFIFVLVLLGAFHKVEELTYSEIQFRKQTAELMSISTLYYRCVGLISVYVISHDQKFLLAFDSVYEKLNRKSELLDLLAAGKASGSSELKTRTGFKKVLKGLSELRQLLAQNVSNVGNRFLRAAELEQDVEAALNDLNQMMSERSSRALAESKTVEQGRWIFLGSVLGGFAANLLLSSAMLAIFSKDFARRFNTIVDNTRRLPQGLPLNETVGGKDELADLDRFFHKMSQELKETQEGKEQLMSMVSHDMRNPLAALALTIGSMLVGVYGELADTQRARLQSAEKVIKRLSNLVNDILDMEKLRSGKMQLNLCLTDAGSIAKASALELEPIAQAAKVSIEVKLDETQLIADQERLAQIFVNLLANAIKFSPKGSTIELTSEDLDDFVKIKVRDNGPGVAAEYRETIFLPFEQVPDHKRPKKGSTGLGLPICKMLVELHGGKIGVDANESGGSSFWFTLPKAEIEQL